MINLMPDDAKKELRAARANVVLMRYGIVLLCAAAFLALVMGGSYIILMQTKDSANRLVKTNDTKAEVFSQTKEQVNALSSKLVDAKGILDQEVLYSNVLINIGQLMPAGTVIDRIKLDSTSFTGSTVDLKIYAKNTDATIALRDKFQSSPMFSNVSFQSISDSNGGIDNYPVSAQITVTLTKAAAK